jgi:regulator of replication initiation timing
MTSADFSSIDSNSLSEVLEKLRMEREKCSRELIAAEILVTKAEKELEKKRRASDEGTSASLVSGSYDYGFTSQSNGVNVNTKNSVGDEVPSSAIVLAVTNFRRELGNIILALNPQQSNKRSITEEFDPDMDAARQKLKHLKLSNEGTHLCTGE